MTSVEEPIDGLYALPLDEFTSERNALAERLEDRAAEVRRAAGLDG